MEYMIHGYPEGGVDPPLHADPPLPAFVYLGPFHDAGGSIFLSGQPQASCD